MTPRHYGAPIAFGHALEQRIATASTTGTDLIPPGPARAQGREPLPDEVKDVAALLRLALTMAHATANAGELPPFKIGEQRRIRRAALDGRATVGRRHAEA